MPIRNKCRHCGSTAVCLEKVDQVPVGRKYAVYCNGCHASTALLDEEAADAEWLDLHAWQYPHERDFEALQREYSNMRTDHANRSDLIRRLGQFTEVHGRMVFIKDEDGWLILELGADPKEKP